MHARIRRPAIVALWLATVATTCSEPAFAATGAATPAASAQPKAAPRATAAPTPEPTATPLPTPTERARAAFDELVAGTLDRTQLTEALRAELTAARLDAIARVLKPLGAPTAFTLADTRHVEGTTTYDFIVRFAEGPVAFTFGIDDATRRIARLYVRTSRS